MRISIRQRRRWKAARRVGDPGIGPHLAKGVLVRQPRFTKQEHARLGEELYRQRVQPIVEPGNYRRIVALDIESGEFELADRVADAAAHLFARLPDAQIWFVRVGCPAVHRF
jgi:hypothetical protein